MKINDNTIIKDDNPLLREKSQDVVLPLSDEDKQLAYDMLQYVLDSTDEEKAKEFNLKPAVGISAIQIGIPKKLTAIALKDADDKILCQYALANARIVSESVEKTYLNTGEGCLSVVDDHKGYVVRSKKVRIRAFDVLSETEVEIKVSGYLAVVFQHELDHFKGILFYDHINKENPFKAPEDAEVIE